MYNNALNPYVIDWSMFLPDDWYFLKGIQHLKAIDYLYNIVMIDKQEERK